MSNIYGVSDIDLKFRPSYVYKITFKEDGRVYIGSRISSTFLAEDDLWLKYFTSSKVIHDLLKVYETHSDSWEYVILDQFADYQDAVALENSLLKEIPKSDRDMYLNINFSAGGSIIKSNRHAKYLNISTGLIELFPLGTALPEGYANNNQIPPSRKGFCKWIIPSTFETGNCRVEEFPVGAILKSDYDQQKKIDARNKKLEYQKSRTKHTITNGKANKKVYTDLPLPENWVVGKTTLPGGMSGKTHNADTRKLMSKNMVGVKNNTTPWNKGLTKETSETLKQISQTNSIKQKGIYYGNSCKGIRKFYNINTGEECKSHSELTLPWKIGSRATAIMTPYGIVGNYVELKTVCGLSQFLVEKKMKESPNEWYYMHP